MLVLSRKSGQKIIINYGDEELEISVLSEAPFRTVKLGFKANLKFHIVREELLYKYTDEIRRQKA